MDKHIKAGLVTAGYNEEHERLWIGTGKQWNDYDESEFTCKACNGTGKVVVNRPNREADDMIQTEEECECTILTDEE